MRAMHAIAAKFDLVTVRSPGVDRRALSQAWYDALHISQRESIRARPGPGGRFPTGAPAFSGAMDGERKKWASRLFHDGKVERPGGQRPRVAGAHCTPSASSERRARLSSLASDILMRLRSQPKATRLVFEVPQGRICLYVVRGERRVQIAAFCPPTLRDVVERALGQVRYAL